MQTQLRDVEYFAAIVEHGQVQRAAAALGLTQPALSKSLRRLERQLGTRLVERTPKGITLTAVGQALYANARRLRVYVDDISREVEDLTRGERGHLRVGTAATFAPFLIPKACALLVAASPKVTAKISVDARENLLTRLVNGELDVAVTTVESATRQGLQDERLCDDEYVSYASANHRLATRRQLELADLTKERWVMSATDGPTERQWRRAFLEAGLPVPPITTEASDLVLRMQMVADSDLLGFGSRNAIRSLAARAGVTILRVNGLSHARHIGVSYRKDAYLSPLARRFIEILKATARDDE